MMVRLSASCWRYHFRSFAFFLFFAGFVFFSYRFFNISHTLYFALLARFVFFFHSCEFRNINGNVNSGVGLTWFFLSKPEKKIWSQELATTWRSWPSHSTATEHTTTKAPKSTRPNKNEYFNEFPFWSLWVIMLCIRRRRLEQRSQWTRTATIEMRSIELYQKASVDHCWVKCSQKIHNHLGQKLRKQSQLVTAFRRRSLT